MHLLRIAKILGVAHRHGIDEMLIRREPSGKLAAVCRFLRLWKRKDDAEAVRLRRFLEDLGPIFVKFGQVLSTRRDLLPVAIADEFAKLQDHVPPFSAARVHAQIKAAYGKPAGDVFAEFDETPVASASVAQVHFARLHAEDGGREVAVKILRPDIENVIAHDLALLDTLAGLMELLWSDGKRLKPRETVAEFAKYLYDELDLMREAANGSQLRRNFKDSDLLLVPEMYWEYCSTTVIVMDRMRGIPISHNEALLDAGVSLSKLSRAGVEIFL
ncbi:MAG: ubiquinone biosynthesis regulatory protein kinase UbiB, partial [Azoarcus sp.]|nr:ubiquinone biosynthesis regulatory protein kinase UbiB [Azoarcus sp.]